jgi:hypothetical protein
MKTWSEGRKEAGLLTLSDGGRRCYRAYHSVSLRLRPRGFEYSKLTSYDFRTIHDVQPNHDLLSEFAEEPLWGR